MEQSAHGRRITFAVLVVGLVLSAAMLFIAAKVLMTRGGPVGPSGPADGPGAATSGSGPTAADDDARRAHFRAVKIDDFELLDQHGNRFTRADLANGDRYTVLDFTFTHCTTACPIMNGSMLRIYDSMRDRPVQFISVSVDPVNDTPERLREHAGNLGVDGSRWKFLHGDHAVIMRIAESLGFRLTPDPSMVIPLPEGGSMVNIIHPTRFVLFGPDGAIIDSYRGMEEADVDRLIVELGELTRGGGGAASTRGAPAGP